MAQLAIEITTKCEFSFLTLTQKNYLSDKK